MGISVTGGSSHKCKEPFAAKDLQQGLHRWSAALDPKLGHGFSESFRLLPVASYSLS